MTNEDRIAELCRTADRIELMVEKVDKKVEKLDDKLDGHSETLARHDIRLASLEKTAQRQWERFALWATVLAALIAGVISIIH